MSKLSSTVRNEVKSKTTYMPYHHVEWLERGLGAVGKSDGMSCSFSCASAVEALLSDLGGWYFYADNNQFAFSENETTYIDGLALEEKELLSKLQALRKPPEKKDGDSDKKKEPLTAVRNLSIFGEWDRGSKIYQDYRVLVKIRNALAHLQSVEMQYDHETGTCTGYPFFLDDLIQKKIVVKAEEYSSWVSWLNNEKFCLWCIKTAYNTISTIFEMLPKAKTSRYYAESNSFNPNEAIKTLKRVQAKQRSEQDELINLRIEVIKLREQCKELQEAAALN